MFFKRRTKKLVPGDSDLRRWCTAEWPEYQEWLDGNCVQKSSEWNSLRLESGRWSRKPLLSVITPVFDTDPGYLFECLISVLAQSYENWELCIVDDGSTRIETIEMLSFFSGKDCRIRIRNHKENQGICKASNAAINMSRGDFAVFLDHDDRLAPDALYHVSRTILEEPGVDVIYSDRDMISPRDQRYMHLLKPSWSPETILSGNYCFHLMAYRVSLLRFLGGLRPEYEGSQDYDLILRASEKTDNIYHIPRVLYHWRQAERSIAKNEHDKEYTFINGLKAVREAFDRRKIEADITEDETLWRGHYRINFAGSQKHELTLLRPSVFDDPSRLQNQIFEQLKTSDNHVAVVSSELELTDESLDELGSWFAIPGVGMVTGKIADERGNLVHAGLVMRYDGTVHENYKGFEESHSGYMAVTATARNVLVPHPYCFVVHKKMVDFFPEKNNSCQGLWAIFDIALKMREAELRCVYNPHARFVTNKKLSDLDNQSGDISFFRNKWKHTLIKGDPFYNPGLTLMRRDMSLMDLSEKKHWDKIISTTGE